MVLLRNFINIFYVPELRRKILFTLGILIIHRIGNHIPVVGIDIDSLSQALSPTGGIGSLFSYLDLFSGGNLRNCTLFALGIMPYITASIMMQMLSMSVPALEQLSKEGEYGRKIINQYTRYLSLLVSVIQGFGISMLVERAGLVMTPGWAFRIMFILCLAVGSMFIMWLGEQISLFGVGNGSSMIIFAGIVARFPADIGTVIASVTGQIAARIDPVVAVALLLLVVLMTACIVFLEKGERKIPVQYARRVVGQRMYGGQSTYIPFKINTPGVMPVIFANAVLNIPMFATSLLAARWEFFKGISEMLRIGGLLHGVLDFVLIIAFSFFYTAMVYNPEELAENIKKSGGFIPGIRPGKKTAAFFNYILTRIGLVGAIYLATLALLPSILHAILLPPGLYLSILGGTGLLIVVGVALETASQIESYLIEHRYEGFLSSGKMKGRGAR